MLGDSEYYLASMRSIWGGEWGGATFRAPLYAWFLAAVGGPVVASTLVSLMIWLVGVDLSRRVDRWIALLWLFDPVFLVLGLAIMSDALFALFVYGSVLMFRAYRQSPDKKSVPLLGVFLAATILTRPIGILFAILVAAFMLVPPTRARFAAVLIAGTLALGLVFPRLYWNFRHDSGWTIAAQGETFQMAVAAAVEYAGSGLSYTATEAKWVSDHAENPRDSALIRETLLRKFPTWLKLSIKGGLRTLFGHVNVEVGTFAIGHPVVGPGWFSEGNPGTPWSSEEKGLWIFGLLITIAYAVVEYVVLLPAVFTGFPRISVWHLWIVLGAAGFTAAPQLFGDCRFRLPLLALLFAAQTANNCGKSPKGDRG